jgi:hypothetical protein
MFAVLGAGGTCDADGIASRGLITSVLGETVDEWGSEAVEL